ncbi:MAG: PVC-type heme-binding CxxCH protein [Planctomyces sp.]
MRGRTSRLSLLMLVSLLMVQAVVAQQQDQFALGVRDTEPVSAEEQHRSFELPAGFRVHLVASEPQVAKPMNLAVDARGRLWVSSSEEYPFAAAADAVPRDTIRILEDTDGDFRADRSTVFADGLNIPIGLIPWQDGVICFSIPNIWLLRDTDGDGVCDSREVLYGPFDTSRDTHGMCNAFRRGDDGWIYACHGFNNRSEVAGRDGHRVVLTSGNTFRFRPDGSRIELYTQGQVNPFGMAIDQLGDIYTADCHTKPVTLLLPGGCYDSFGRPHDGLGYVPNVMDHLHGSTAIAALALGAETLFPAEYADSTFDGNVMTSRINRNQLQRRGSSVRAVEQPDLVSSRDPWFRPVDLVAGPDGALYVADFYNRIIGHYEVDLKHPGRDRYRGRIWRVSWEAADAGRSWSTGYGPDLTVKTAEQLIEVLSDGTLPQQRLARDLLLDREGDRAIPLLRAGLRAESPQLRRNSLRLLVQLGAVSAADLSVLLTDVDETVRVHVFRALRESAAGGALTADSGALLLRGFGDLSALVRRAAVAAAAVHCSESLQGPLLRLLLTTELGDVHLRHSVRMALRNHLLQEDWLQRFAGGLRLRSEIAAVADLCLAVKSAAGAAFVARSMPVIAELQPARLPEYLQYAAAQVSPEAAGAVVGAIRSQFVERPDEQVRLLSAMARGFTERRQPIPESVLTWAESLVLQQLGMRELGDVQALQQERALTWSAVTTSGGVSKDNCWGVTTSRRCADGVEGAVLFSSFESGEQKTGRWQSESFRAPSEFSFYVAGHDGFPDRPLKQVNVVRLVDAGTGQVLRQVSPPRNDVAQQVNWSLQGEAGRPVRLELVDGDSATAYAWLAAGRFSVAGLNPSDQSRRRGTAIALIAEFGLQQFAGVLEHLTVVADLSGRECSEAAGALAKLRGSSVLAALALVPQMPEADQQLVWAVRGSFGAGAQADSMSLLKVAFHGATAVEQQQMAELLAADSAGAAVLAGLIEAGQASARLLQRPAVQLRLQAVASEDVKRRMAEIVAQLPEETAETDRLISERRQLLSERVGVVESGRELFRKNCQICHQVAGEGRQVGPNLDGVASRGVQRMLEDILAPSRNVDVAFRTTTIVTKDGQAISGLLKELTDERVSMTDSQGRETILPAADLDERRISASSPMPANVAEILTADQFVDLVAYLQTLSRQVELAP